MTLLLPSCGSFKKTQRTVTPEIALVVNSKPIADFSEMKAVDEKEVVNKGEVAAKEEAEKEDTMIKYGHEYIYFKFGVAYANEGKYDEAIAAYKQAIKINPDLTEAHYNLSLSYLILGDKNSAFKEYKILKNLDPQKADNLYKDAIFRNSLDREKIHKLMIDY
jgi:tetratricopeptide (TPR) repeat protein